jgi:hypothetical protein
MRRLIATMVAAAAVTAMSGGAAQACIDCGKGASGPVTGTGVTSVGGGTTYTALNLPGKRTLVEAFSGATVMRWKVLDGLYGVPSVAAFVPEGLSFDGRKIVLERFASAFPKRRSAFAVLRTRSLRVERTIELRGDFTYDALSPDGRVLYLIEHPQPNRPGTYSVRALDLDSGRLFAKPVADPWEGPRMSGYAVSRTWSSDGIWAYTLYQQGNKKMFVHALNTEMGKARCIDLPPIAIGSDGMTISPDGGVLTVSLGAQPRATVDTQTFSARVWNATPAPAQAPKASGPPAHEDSGGAGWMWAAGFVTILLLAAAGAHLHSVRWRPRRSV